MYSTLSYVGALSSWSTEFKMYNVLLSSRIFPKNHKQLIDIWPRLKKVVDIVFTMGGFRKYPTPLPHGEFKILPLSLSSGIGDIFFLPHNVKAWMSYTCSRL
jgi:hypothetical protein